MPSGAAVYKDLYHWQVAGRSADGAAHWCCLKASLRTIRWSSIHQSYQPGMELAVINGGYFDYRSNHRKEPQSHYRQWAMAAHQPLVTARHLPASRSSSTLGLWHERTSQQPKND